MARLGWIVWLTVFVPALWGQVLSGKYVIEYGIFGKMGTAEATLERNATRYKIEMTAVATGLAKVLSGGRVEKYRSEGRIEKGWLVPDLYAKDIAYSGKRRIKTYRFDHAHKKVAVSQRKFRDGKMVQESNATLPYYAQNDIFSLYFNILRIIGDCSKPYDRDLHAVGAEKHTGKVHVQTLTTPKDRLFVKELLGEADCYLKVTIFQKLFGSKGGELYLALGKDGTAKTAVLKDVVMFGDVRGRMVSFKESK
ncbi:MAG: DUF3108 domain-containing protein [Epsilonproteobacteria bacterium]|nr:DUF3108 domain-containing protein [Campylobacterota bacterium]